MGGGEPGRRLYSQGMAAGAVVGRGRRMMFAALAMLFTLLVLADVEAVKDFRQDPGLHWGNGGEIQITGFILLVGVPVCATTLVLLVMPMLWLWREESRRRHPFVVLLAVLAWPLLLNLCVQRQGPRVFLAAVRWDPGFFLAQDGLALLAYCGYKALLSWQQRRLDRRPAIAG